MAISSLFVCGIVNSLKYLNKFRTFD